MKALKRKRILKFNIQRKGKESRRKMSNMHSLIILFVFFKLNDYSSTV